MFTKLFDDDPNECPNCENENLAYYLYKDSKDGVVDGRLNLHDVSIRVYLCCLFCSETIRVYSDSTFMRRINEMVGLRYE